MDWDDNEHFRECGGSEAPIGFQLRVAGKGRSVPLTNQYMLGLLPKEFKENNIPVFLYPADDLSKGSPIATDKTGVYLRMWRTADIDDQDSVPKETWDSLATNLNFKTNGRIFARKYLVKAGRATAQTVRPNETSDVVAQLDGRTYKVLTDENMQEAAEVLARLRERVLLLMEMEFLEFEVL